MTPVAPGYIGAMSDPISEPMLNPEVPPPDDADRPLTEDDLDPEAPTDSTVVHPPRDDGDRPADMPDDLDELLREENAATSLDQPSESSS